MPPIKQAQRHLRTRSKDILSWKAKVERLTTVLVWTVTSCCFCLILGFDISHNGALAFKAVDYSFSAMHSLTHLGGNLSFLRVAVLRSIVYYSEAVALCVVGLNALSQMVLVLIAYTPYFALEVTQKEQELYGISQDLPGFKVVTTVQEQKTSSDAGHKLSTDSQKNVQWLFSVKKSRFLGDTSFGSDATAYSPSDATFSEKSFLPASPYRGGGADISFHASPGYSAFYDSYQSSDSFHSAFHQHEKPVARSPPPPTAKEIMDRYRRARSCMPKLTGDLASQSVIDSPEQLRDYLNSLHDRESSRHFARENLSFSYDLGHGGGDYSILAGHTYHAAVPSPVKQPARSRSKTREPSLTPGFGSEAGLLFAGSGKPVEKSGAREPETGASSQTWVLEAEKLDICSQNIRTWLSGTIFKPLVKQINAINAKLEAQGHSRIGDSTIASLGALTTQYPKLKTILPYLALGQNLEYVVARLNDLTLDGCLGVYRWNKGGSWKGKEWSEHLPTDAAFVFHVFCTYMNAALPPNSLYAHGKAFTGHYVISAQGDSPPQTTLSGAGYVDLSNGTKICVTGSPIAIHQESIRPPNFQLVLRGSSEDKSPPTSGILTGGETKTAGTVDILDVERGRENLFYTLILFFQYFQASCNGHIEAVSLGSSGLNVDWIFK